MALSISVVLPVFNAADYLAEAPEIVRQLGTTTPIVHSTVMLRAEPLRDVGGYRRVFTVAEDHDLFLRLADRHRMANLADPLVECRLHGSQRTVHGLETAAMQMLA